MMLGLMVATATAAAPLGPLERALYDELSATRARALVCESELEARPAEPEVAPWVWPLVGFAVGVATGAVLVGVTR